jgi:hypothetical protein
MVSVRRITVSTLHKVINNYVDDDNDDDDNDNNNAF